MRTHRILVSRLCFQAARVPSDQAGSRSSSAEESATCEWGLGASGPSPGPLYCRIQRSAGRKTRTNHAINGLRLNGVFGGYPKSLQVIEKMERETGFEPATSSLGSWAVLCFQ